MRRRLLPFTMSKLLRYHRPEDTCFITAVTYNRSAILHANEPLLLESFGKLTKRAGIKIIAYAILRDHFHLLVDCVGNDLSLLMKRIKLSFAVSYRNKYGRNNDRIWQRRFWDHIIRNQTDMNNHFDYIHYNPVKHGYVKKPLNWKYSSIHDYPDYYGDDWGVQKAPVCNGEFGE